MSTFRGKDQYGDKRKLLFKGLQNCLDNLIDAGCKAIYIDGSFVSDKSNPGDYDLCWNPIGVDTTKLDPVFFDFNDLRKNQKIKFLGEFFPSSTRADGTNTFLDYFQIDKYTGNPKGIIKLI